MAHPKIAITPKVIPEVVIKLGLSPVSSQESTHVFRRLTYEQLHSSHVSGGPVCALQGYAVLLAQGVVSGQDSAALQNVLLENYSIALIYTDKDGDNTLICTNGDLMAALQEYQPEGKLKILAQVKSIHESATSVSSSRSTQTIPPQTVTVSTNTVPVPAMADAAGTQPSVVTPPENSPPASVGATESTHQPKSDVVTADVTQAVPESAATATDSSIDRNTARTATPEEAVVRPFIHGRHTCDGCLTTPIIGNRYHAMNLDDYDLCESCANKYKGDVLKFEVAELDIDRPFQDRWHHRHSRIGVWNRNNKPWIHMANQVANACTEIDRRKWIKGARRGRCYGHGNGRCEQRNNGWNQPSSSHSHPSGSPPPQENHSEEVIDAAITEAIRRSLLDLSVTRTSTSDNLANQDAVKPNENEDQGKHELNVPKKESPSSDVYKKESIVEMKALAGYIRNGSITEIESYASSDDGGNGNNNDESRSVNREPSFSSFSSDVGRIDDEGDDRKVLAQVNASSTNKSMDGPDSPNSKNSFAVEAEGMGEAATTLGETLDRFANLIDSLDLLEHRSIEVDHSALRWNAASDLQNTNVDVADEVANGQTEPDETGIAIVDGEEQGDAKEEDDHESWQVVAEDEQFAYDEALAKAAQLIGSALFNSDMARSGELESQVSSLSSVPTTVPSVAAEPTRSVPIAQLDRWAIQLNQLHELGFLNDEMNVDTLERLNAANIGVDISDEITVQQVVNEIVKDW